MAVAETARLVASLELKDKFTPGANKAIATVGKLDKSLSATTNRITTGTGKAFGNLKSRLTGLSAAIGPLLGVGGLLGLTGLLTSSVNEAAAFGDAVVKVKAVTGLTTQAASAMVDTLDKWGISSDRLLPILGKLEKNVGTIADKTDGAKKFQEQYGVSILNTSGRIADANTLLLRSADYFNSNATATDKATFMAKLWGKAWQDLVPILAKGSKFIRAQEADSIKLTDTQLRNIVKFRSAQRDFADAFGDLQVKIGSEVMPLITTGLTEVTKWFDQNETKVSEFFHDAAIGAGDFAKSAGEIFDGLKKAWNSIPPDVRDFLVKGLIADRTVKFLFGFSPVEFATGALTKGLGGVFGQFVARGSSPANPLWTKEVGLPGGGLPGGAGAGAAGAAQLGLGTTLIGLAGAAVIGGLIAEAVVTPLASALNPEALAGAQRGESLFNRDPRRFDKYGRIIADNVSQVASNQDKTTDAIEKFRMGATNQGDRSYDSIERQRMAITALAAKMATKMDSLRQAVLRGRTARELRAQEEQARHGGMRVTAVRKGGSDALKVIDYMTALAVRGTSPWYKKADNIKRAIDAAKAAQKTAIRDGNTTLARKFGTDIRILQGVVDDIKPAVDRTTAAVQANTLAQAGMQGAIVGAIAAIKPPVVNVNVSPTTINYTTTQQNRYGSTNGSRGTSYGSGAGGPVDPS